MEDSSSRSTFQRVFTPSEYTQAENGSSIVREDELSEAVQNGYISKEDRFAHRESRRSKFVGISMRPK